MKGYTEIDGKIYISSSRAHEVSGYSKDYIGQLCRGKKIEARMIGRSWYVNEESLLKHKKDAEEILQIRNREYAAESARAKAAQALESVAVSPRQEPVQIYDASQMLASVEPVAPAAPVTPIASVAAPTIINAIPEIPWTLSYSKDERPLLPTLQKKVITAGPTSPVVSGPIKSPFMRDIHQIAATTAMITVLGIGSVYAMHPELINSTFSAAARQVVATTLDISRSAQNAIAALGDQFSNAGATLATASVGDFFRYIFGRDSAAKTDTGTTTRALALKDAEDFPYYLGGMTTSNFASAPKTAETPLSSSGTSAGTGRSAAAYAPALSSQLSLADVDARIRSALASFVPWQPTYTFISGQSTNDVTASGVAIGSSIMSAITGGTANFNGASLTVSGQATVGSINIAGGLNIIYGPINPSLGTNTLLSTDSNGNISATTSPSVAAIFATSTTATSVFAGMVGIGTTTPSATFAVQGNTAISGDLSSVSNIFATGTVTTANLLVTNSTTFAHTSTTTFNGDILARGVSAWSYLNAPFIQATSTTATSTFAGGLVAGGTNGLSVLQNGLVGIGTTSPSQALSIQGNALLSGDVSGANLNATGTVIARSFVQSLAGIFRGDDQFHQIVFHNVGNNTDYIEWGDTLANGGGHKFFTGGAAPTLRFEIADDGVYARDNVGVGTTSPGAKLAVAGNSNSSTPVFLVSTSTASATTTAFIIDNNGKVGIGTTSPSSELSVNGSVYISQNLLVGGNNITLGNSSANTLTVNSTINSSLVPNQNATYNLGSPSFFWNDAYINNLNVNNISAASTTIAGTSNSTFTINSDNSSADLENMSLVFYRGTVVPNALITWNSAATAKRFEFNQSLFVQNASGSTTQPGLVLQGVSGQVADIAQVKDSLGNLYLNVAANGSVGIGTTTPSTNLGVQGNGLFSGNVSAANITATGTLTVNNLAVAGNTSYTGIGTTTFAGDILARGISAWQYMNVPFIQATSTTATSSFAGGIRGANNFVVQQGSGRVGIGTSTPTTMLSVQAPAETNILQLSVPGRGKVTVDQWGETTWNDGGDGATPYNFARLTYENTADGILQLMDDSVTKVQLKANGASYFNSGSVGIGTTSPWGQLSVNPNALGSGVPEFVIGSSTRTHFIVDGGGRVGIGTTSFSDLLDGGTNAYALSVDTTGVMAARFASSFSAGTGIDIQPAGGQTWRLFAATSGASAGRAGNLEFQTDNTVGGIRMTLSNSGNVGIGSSTPYARLSVKGAGSTTGVNFQTTNSSNSPLFTILDNGNVGIGTTTPFATLAVNPVAGAASNQFVVGSSSATSFAIDNSGAVGIGTLVPNPNGDLARLNVFAQSGNRGVLEITGNTADADAIVQADIVFAGASNSSTGNTRLALVRAFTSGSTANNRGSALTFYTRPDGGAAGSVTERMRIDNAGNVGIGTTSPFAKLSVTGSGTGAGRAFVVTDSAGAPLVHVADNGSVGLGTASPSGRLYVVGDTNTQISVDGTNASRVAYYVGGTAKAEVGYGPTGIGGTHPTGAYFTFDNLYLGQQGGNTLMSILSSGNVGIGTTSPSKTLSVQGNALVSGDISAANLTATGTVTTAFASTTNITSTGYAAFATVSGNVGIGTTSPQQKLHVSGTDAAIAVQSPTGKYAYLTAGSAGTALGFDQTGFFQIGRISSVSATTQTNDFRINTNGNVGINSTNGSYPLIVHTGTDNNLGVRTISSQLQLLSLNDADSAYAAMRIDGSSILLNTLSGGNVGIGTTTPGTTLAVQGTGLVANYLTASYFNATSTIATSTHAGPVTAGTANYANSAGSPILGVSGAKGITSAGLFTNQLSVLDTTSGTGNAGVGGAISFDGNSGGGVNTTYAAVSGYKENGTATDFAGALAFYSRIGGGNLTEKMRISSQGNVGIGTTTPFGKLNVESSTNGDPKLGFFNNPNSGSAAEATLYVSNGYSTAESLFMEAGGTGLTTAGGFVQDSGIIGAGSGLSGGLSIMTRANAPIRFYTNGHTNERMRIDETGNVGLGTTTPSQLLAVQGNALISGNVSAANLTATGTLQLAGGTANAPALWFSGDSTTGIYRDASTVLRVSIAGSRVASFVATGLQLLGGTTAASGPSLSIDAAGNTGLFSPAAATIGFSNGGAETVRITSGGNVGIGTTTPSQLFSVGGDAVFGTSNGSVAFALNQSGNTTASTITRGSNYQQFGVYTGSTFGGLISGSAQVSASNGLSFNSGTSAFPITFSTDNWTERMRISPTSGNVGIGTTSPFSSLSINTSAGTNAFSVGSSSLTYFTISQTGKVGIGNSAPAAPLEVTASSSLSSPIAEIVRLSHTGGTSSSGTQRAGVMTFYDTDNGTLVGGLGGIRTSPNGDYNGGLTFYYNNSSGVPNGVVTGLTEGMRLVSGNLGIGTTSPARTLSVQGSALISGDLSVANLTATGTLTVGGFNVTGAATTTFAGDILARGISAWSYLNAPFIQATSTTATSTFAGGMNVAGSSGLSVLQNGLVGIGTAAPGYKLDIQSASANAQIKSTTGINEAYINFSNTSGGLYVGANNSVGNALLSSGNIPYAGVITTTVSQPLVFGTNFSTRMLIDTAGNIGIGTTTPSAKLSVTGSGTGGGRVFAIADSSNTERLSLTDNGQMLITSNQRQPLQITSSNTSDTILDIINTSSGGKDWQIRSIGSGGTNVGSLVFFGGGGQSDMEITSSGQVKFLSAGAALSTQNCITTQCDGYQTQYFSAATAGVPVQYAPAYRLDSSAWNSSSVAAETNSFRIDAVPVSVAGTTNAGMNFEYANSAVSSGAFSTLMTLRSSGNVGIGTTTPAEKLTVRGDTITVRHITSNNIMASIGQRGSGVDGGFMQLSLAGAAKVSIDSNGDSFLNGGKVGIGASSPESILHVQQSNAGATTTLFIDNNSSATNNSAAAIRFAVDTGASVTNGGAQIAAINTNSGNGATALTFTNYTGGANAENMRITSTGNVGIGTTTPTYKLSVSSGSTDDSALQLQTSRDITAAVPFSIRWNSATPAIDDTLYLVNGRMDSNSAAEAIQASIAMTATNVTHATRDSALTFITMDDGTLSEKLRITGAGNVGIGSTSPNSIASNYGTLVVNGTSGGGTTFGKTSGGTATLYADDGSSVLRNDLSTMNMAFSTGGSTRMTILSGGNVGIATTSPTAKFEVLSSVGAVTVFDTTNATGGYTAWRSSGNNNGLVGSGGTVISGGSANDFAVSAYGTGGLVLGTNGGTARMTILNGGNVGIGTTSPMTQLQVGGAANGNGAVYFRGTGSNVADISLGRSDTSWRIANETNFRIYNGSAYNPNANTTLPFDIAGGAPTGSFVITSSGNIGIGTTSPTEKLSVAATGSNVATLTLAAAGGDSFTNSDLKLADFSTGNAWHLIMRHDRSNAFHIYSNANFSSPEFTIASNGNVGLGDATPEFKLEVPGTFGVSSSENNDGDRFLVNSSGNVGIGTTTPDITAYGATGKVLSVIGGSSSLGVVEVGSAKSITDGNIIGDLAFVDGNYLNGNAYRAGLIRSTLKGSSATDIGGELGFFTKADAGALTERLTIKNTGNVGIGSTSPNSKLVVGTSDSTTYTSISNTLDKTLSSGYTTEERYALSTNAYSSWGSTYSSTNGLGGLRLGAGAPGGTSGFAYITAGSSGNLLLNPVSGNVGIGTTTPDWTLSVAKATGDAIASINAIASNGDAGLLFESSGDASNAWLLKRTDTGNFSINHSTSNNYSGGTLKTPFIIEAGAASNSLYVTAAGNVGIGTTSPATQLGITGSGSATIRLSPSTGYTTDYGYLGMTYTAGAAEVSDNIDFKIQGGGTFTTGGNIRFSTQPGGAAPVERLRITKDGNIGIGTTSPYAALSVAGATGVLANIFTATSTTATSTFAGGLDVGNGALRYDFSTGATSIQNLELGNMTFDADSGVVTWADMPITSASANGTINSYTAGLNGNPLLTVFGKSDGAGSATNLGVGVGTTSPWARLSVDTSSMTLGMPEFAIGSSTRTDLTVTQMGNVGIGTTSPWAALSVSGATTGQPQAVFRSTSSAISPAVELADNSTNRWWLGSGISSGNDGKFFVYDAARGAVRQTIDTSGNIGIGTTSPARTLSVQGSALISGSAAVANLMATGTVSAQDGSQSQLSYSFNGATTHGFYYLNDGGGNGIAVVNGGSTYWRFNNDGHFSGNGGNPSFALYGNASTLSNVAYGFTSDANTGMHSPGGDQLQLVTGGVAALTVGTTQNVGIGTSTPWAQLSTTGKVAFPGISNGAGTAYVCLTLTTGELSTSTSACNPSSIRFKDNVQDSTYGLSQILAMRPVSYTYKPEMQISGNQIGFIAEEMEGVVPEVVGYDAQGLAANIDYAKLAPVIVSAIQDMQSAINTQNAPTSTVSIMIDGVGNVGIGTGTTTYPQYKLAVQGDVAATSFVNISTRDAKTDISYLDDNTKDGILDTISTLGIAQYHYKTENQADPLRLGLIAEEAPAAVLAVGGKGVDVYKLSTYTLAGVQAQQRQIKALKAAQATTELTVSSTTKAAAEAQITIFDLVGLSKTQGDKIAEIQTRLDTLTARVDSLATSTAAMSDRIAALQAELTALRNSVNANTAASANASSTASATVATSTIQSILSSMGEWFVNKLSATIVITDRIEAKTIAVSEGFDIKDQASGVTWCVTIKNGDWTKVPWACGTPASATAAALEGATQTTPITQASTVNVPQNDTPSNTTMTGGTNAGTTTPAVAATSTEPTAPSVTATTTPETTASTTPVITTTVEQTPTATSTAPATEAAATTTITISMDTSSNATTTTP